MARAGAVLVHYRAELVEKLSRLTPAIHREFSGAREELELRYQTVSTVTDPLAGGQLLLEQLVDHWQRHRQAEISARQCLSGPHKGGLEVRPNLRLPGADPHGGALPEAGQPGADAGADRGVAGAAAGRRAV